MGFNSGFKGLMHSVPKTTHESLKLTSVRRNKRTSSDNHNPTFAEHTADGVDVGVETRLS